MTRVTKAAVRVASEREDLGPALRTWLGEFVDEQTSARGEAG